MEAVIDIRCANPPNLTLRDLNHVAATLAPEFAEESQVVEITETFEPSGAHQRTERPAGYLLRHREGKNAVQLKLFGLSYSRLAPYERWEKFRDEAKDLWVLYVGMAKPVTVRRVGVRYINRLQFGAPTIEDFTPFLRLHPVTPWNLSSPPDGFTLQIRHRLDDGKLLVLNEATVQYVETGEMAVILDLDAFLERDFPVEDDTLWNLVERLHVEVEQAFEASITDRVRELLR